MVAAPDRSERLKNLSPAKRTLLLKAMREEAARSKAARSIPPRSQYSPAPLSFAQQRLWFLDRLVPGSPIYNLFAAIHLTGTLDVDAFDQSLNEIVRRHEALRTTFAEVDDQPVQVIAPVRDGEQPLPLLIVDLSGLPAPRREGAALRYAAEESRRPFDLARGPLLRTILLRLDAAEHVLLLTMHHIVSDGWSMGVLIREIAALYSAFVAGNPSPLAELPIQYADYAIWQRVWLLGKGEHAEQGQVAKQPGASDSPSPIQAQLAYWRSRLGGDLPVLDLPTDRLRPTMQSYRGASQPITLPQQLSDALATLSRQADVTLFMTLLATFKVLLYRYTGQDDIVVGSPIANRGRAETEGLIGFFVNTLVMRTDLSGRPTFRALLQRMGEVTLGAYVHQDLPFEQLVEALQPVRDPSRHPLFQVLFVLQNAPMPPLELAGLVLTPLELTRDLAKFDLTLSMEETPGGLQGALQYNTDLFDAATISRMLGHFHMLLEGVVAHPDRRISDVPLMTDAERCQLAAWNDIRIGYPADTCVHQLFTAQAARTPDAVALVFNLRDTETRRHGDTEITGRTTNDGSAFSVQRSAFSVQLTYAELNRRANQLAHYLQQQGVGPDQLVGLCLERTPDLVIALLGILKAGGAYLPLDPALPPDRLAFMLAETRVPLLLTHDHLRSILHPAVPIIVALDSAWPTIAQERVDNPTSAVTVEHLAYVTYTSGSTGKPKGSAIPHRSLLGFMLGVEYSQFDAEQTLLNYSSISWDAFTLELWPALICGARCVLYPAQLPTPHELDTVIQAQRVSLLWLTATLFNTIIDTAPETLAGVAQLLVGGEALSTAHVHRALERLPTTRIVNGYGPSECTVFTCCYPIPRPLPDTFTTIPIGHPIGDRRVYLLDPQLQQVPPGVPGELYVGGPAVARGYLHRPALTAEKFRPDPFSPEPGARMYQTGDLVRLGPDRLIAFIRRIDAQVKIRGFRVEPGEIETLLAQHPAVQECAILVREDTPGDKRLVAYVVPQDVDTETRRHGDTEASYLRVSVSPGLTPQVPSFVSELRAFLQKQLPDYMVPAAFVLLDALPLTSNGKLNRTTLPAPERFGSEPDTRYVAPRSQVERMIAVVWQEVLQVEHVGIHDNFFDLGGHSLRLIQLHHRLQDLFAREVTIIDLFNYPTVAALASYISPDTETAPPQLGLDRQQPGHTASRSSSADIAIIGMAGRFPGARDLGTFWHNLRDGVESIARFTDEELAVAGVAQTLLRDPQYVKAGAVLEDVEWFDATFFGLSPREAEIMDPQQRVFLECAWEALEQAGYDPDSCTELIGVYAGTSMSSYLLNLYTNPAIIQSVGEFQVQLGNDKDHLPTHVAYKLNLRGPSVNVQTACSTSLVALHLACQGLLNEECAIALAGGVSIHVPQGTGYLYREGGIASPDGHCRAFDANAAGTIKGNGVGIVVLKRLVDALADGDTIHAVVKGSAINNDGAQRVGYTAPSVAGQAAAIIAAQAAAGIDPTTISYVETHGTATPLGDPIEVAALTEAFRTQTDQRHFCAIGSLKTNIGHLDAAAGVAGLIKTVLALQHRQIPPSLHFAAPNPQIDFADSPFYVNTILSDWPAGSTPRRAGVSAFGLGGANAHIVIEEAPPVEATSPSRPYQLLVLSARTETALDATSKNLVAFLRQNSALDLADVAYTLQVGRRGFRHRRMLVCADRDDAAQTLEMLDPRQVLTGRATEQARSIVFLFSGQGAQYVHMGRELYATEPIFRAHVDHCADLLRPLLGRDVRDVLYPGDLGSGSVPAHAGHRAPPHDLRVLLGRSGDVLDPATALLDRIELAQPAVFVIAYALTQLWMEWGVRPQALLGYSLGEYVAACLAGVLTLEATLALVVKRAQLIAGLPPSAMLAIGLGEAELRPMLGDQLSFAAINGPSLCVVGGSPPAVAALRTDLTNRGVATRYVQTSHAYHSHMMAPIRAAFTDLVRGFALQPPRIPYLSNVTGTWITAAEATDPQYWASHLCQPVRFAEGLARIWELPEVVLLEVGPGQALGSLALQHPASKGARDTVVLASLPPAHQRQSDRAFLLQTLGQLWLAGVSVEWTRLYVDERRCRVPLPTYPFERQRYWIEPHPQVQAGDSQLRSSQKRADVADWFYIPSWKLSLPPRESKSSDRTRQMERWLVFVDDSGVGHQLVQRLEQDGQDVVGVRVGARFQQQSARAVTLNPEHSGDYDAFFRALRDQGRPPDRIVHCWSVTAHTHQALGSAFFQQAQDTGYYSLLFLCHALERAGMTTLLQIIVVSNHLHRVMDDEITHPEKMTLMGPCKAIPQEYPYITCGCIDIVVPESDTTYAASLIDQLIVECRAKDAGRVIAYRGRQRWLQTFEAVRLDNHVEPIRQLRQGGVYLITGGLGTVGLLLADHLARSVQPRLVLVGRSALPPRDGWEQWLSAHDRDDAVSRKIRRMLALEQLGAEVLVLSADVADEAQMQAVLAQTYARFGTLHGVIHAAATSGRSLRRPVSAIDRGESEAQFGPKVYGLYVLEKLLRGCALDFCLLLSSNSAVLGGLGLLAYSTANLFMDAFAAQRACASDIPWISTNWDGWPKEDGAASQQGVARDQYAMTGEEAVEAFDRIVSLAPVSQVVVSSGDLPARIDLWLGELYAPRNAEAMRAAVASPLHPRPRIQRSYVAPRSALEQRIAAIWQDLLGIEPIGIHDHFFELGGHSLLATQLLSRLRDTFQVELPLHSLFEATTVEEQARVLNMYEAQPGQLEEIALVMEQIERMAAEDVRALLATKREARGEL